MRASAGPSGVSTDSGWNWTPTAGSSRCRTAITSPSSANAVGSSDVGQPRRRERVVAARLERIGQAVEQPAAVVPHRARLPVHELARVADLAAADLDERLVAEADAERRRGGEEPLEDRARRARVGRTAGAGGDDEVRRREPLRLVRVDLVVAPHDDLLAERAEQVREVPRERVVVVDEEDHGCSDSARSIAVSSARSLARHSSCSAAGSESATIPPPACRCATPSRSQSVRIAMHVSSSRSAGRQ